MSGSEEVKEQRPEVPSGREGSDSTHAPRAHLLDALRGFSVLSMVLFHFCYDLRYLAGVSLPWFAGMWQATWRSSISWTFLFLAGVMCSYSRSNLRRATKYGAFALAIFAVTSLVAVDDPISFGIIYCMAACTLVAAVMQRLGVMPQGGLAAAVCLLLFLALLGLPTGHVGIGQMAVKLPRELYSTPFLSWLGLPGPGFVSGDYYPLLPYLLMYLTGASLGPQVKEAFGRSQRLAGLRCAPLEWVGRHALLVYAAHQPVLLVLTMALTGSSL